MEIIREQGSRYVNGYQHTSPEGFNYVDIPGQAQRHQICSCALSVATIESDILELNRRW